jgi:hypothetical protein
MIFNLFKSKNSKKKLSKFDIQDSETVNSVSFLIKKYSDSTHYVSYIKMNKAHKNPIKEFDGWNIEDTTKQGKEYRIYADSMEILVNRVSDFIDSINNNLSIENKRLKL